MSHTPMTTVQQANVLLLGDTHGLNLSPLRALADKGVRDAAVILLGDAGFGFPGEAPNEWAGVDKVLHDMNSELYVLRGNHDNPACFRGDSGYLAPYAHIHALHDFEEVSIGGKLGIVVGGAVSIDRNARTPGLNCWPDAEGVNAALFHSRPKRHYDFVLAHTSPTLQDPDVADSTVYRYALNYSDDTLCDDIVNEQRLIVEICQAYTPDRWFAGHWHVSFAFSWDNTRVQILNIKELLPWPQA